ncbi:MAG: Gfo/Idh/MocA family oxidoreductase [Rhizomicrobium sp.]
MNTVAIIGMGKMGQTRAHSIEKESRARLVKVFDVHYATPTDYPKAASIDEIIQDPKIDSVFVCLPNNFNKPTTIAALKAGKNVFCEKPPAFNADEVRRRPLTPMKSAKSLPRNAPAARF